MFSTNIVFRFSYDGYGLGDHDTLRIISADGQCTDNNYNPNTAAFAYTGLRVDCPVPCNDVGLVGEAVQGDLTTKTLSHNNYKCSRKNDNCQTNDIMSILVISETETELTFQHPHGLMTGQQITLGKNIACDYLDPVCTTEMLVALQSVTDFADRDMNNGQAPETYMLGHFVTTTTNRRKIKISIGWPDPKPKFAIVFANARPEIGYIGRGGEWTLHSRGITKEEVMGTRERANLRVCWRYGGNGAKYVMEVGRLTIRNPAPMDGATLSLTTTLRQTVAPMILTFQTASGVTGARYDDAQDSLRLKIVFTRTDLIDLRYTDLAGKVIPVDVPTEDEVEEASQAICGKLFLEMWSSDMSRGFPFPKGCYYKSYGPPKNIREVFLLFEAKSGLRKNTVYQLVMNMYILEPQPPGVQIPKVKTDGEYMELYPMDDVTNRPYEAIESGPVRLTGEPQAPASDPSHPRFRYPDGFKLVGGHDDILQLRSGESILTELMGDPGAGMITAKQHIRIYLWPLTQWQTTSSCTAECVVKAEVSFKCGTINKCVGVPAVPGMSLNILKMTLPNIFQNLYGDVKIRIRIGGITPPAGGFFPNRLAAQVTTKEDDRPYYILSSGNYIWKEPNVGQPLSKVVSTLGGGNSQPFRGDKDNILYASLILSSTIFARDDTGNDASFTITLPPGYTCLDKSHTMSDGENAWAVSENLPVFRGEIPQGRGTPSAGGKSHGWSVKDNTCTYTPFHPNGVVYAGSALMIKIYADNPANALPRSEALNMWTVRMENRGLHPTLKQSTLEYPFSSSGDPYYQMNYAALGRITDAACQPTNFAPSTKRAVKQELRFFFRTEQTVGEGGSVRLDAPTGFAFDDPCNATDLEDLYYASESDPADATLRLPGIVQCMSSGANLNVAEIKLQNMLVGGRLFGFKIWITNPQSFDLQQTEGWRIFTLDAAGFLTDGTAKTIPFVAAEGGSWGVYAGAKMQAAVSVASMLPYNMTGQTTYVGIEMQNVPQGQSGKIRLIAPEGFIFSFTPSEFVHKKFSETPANLQQYVPPGVTMNFPSGMPTGSGTRTLTWNSAFYHPDHTYGFAVPIKVPDASPKTTSNSFFLELGYEASSAADRVAAVTLQAPVVRALQNAHIDYTTNIQAKENSLQFRIETVTAIPAGGGLEVAAPAGFQFADPCEILPVNDPTAPPPHPFGCRITIGTGDMAGRPMIQLRTQGLPAGVHYFTIITENPLQTLYNYPTGTATPCATHICWRFRSFSNMGSLPPAGQSCCQQMITPPSGQIDLETYSQGFSINTKMLEARIPVLTQVQRYDTGRDDRPMQPNSVIFAFSLTSDAIAGGDMLLRGPYGFIFPESCLPGVEVREANVFGRGNRFPPSYSVWPTGVTITGCHGLNADARLTMTFAPGARVFANKLYLFRIRLTANPLTTPIPNRWTLDFDGQSSEPMEGMTLWAFTDTNIIAVTSARDRTLAGEVRTRNPLKISIRPFNNVPTEGKMAVEAPLGFQIVHMPSMECESQLRELPYQLLGVSYPGYVWPATGLVCLVEPNTNGALAYIHLRDPRPVIAGLLYELVVMVYNPKTILQDGPTTWKVSSFRPNMQTLDESQVTAFSLNAVMNQWYYTNPDPNDPSKEVRNGGTVLPKFTLQMRFPSTLETGDRIVIDVLASDYILDAFGNCSGYEYVGGNPIPNSRYSCTAQQLTIDINEPEPIERDTLIEIGLRISNPLRTPNPAANFWRCRHLGPLPDPPAAQVRSIKSSKAFQGWEVIPQLEQLEVDLMGPLTAAEAVSSIRISFIAVSDAEDVAIRVLYPPRFEFGSATVLDPEQEIFLTDGSLCRVRSKIKRGKKTIIMLNNVKLGREGGQTDFQLTSYTGGMWQSGEWKPGDVMDEKLHFIAGFRLPGRTILRYEKLENDYHRDENTYRVQALWEAQMSRPCYVEFDFELTQEGKIGNFLRLSGAPYEPTMRVFYVEKVNTDVTVGTSTISSSTPNTPVKVEITNLRKNEVRAKLLEPLLVYTKYKVVLSVIAPSPQAKMNHGAPITWTIETLDGGPLPVNTNDGLSMSKPIVEEYVVRATAVKAPPTADIVVDLYIDPGLSIPTEFKVVAPKGFNFTADECLVSGQPKVTKCRPGMPIADDRATAVLSCDENGIREPPPFLRILATTPKSTPVSTAWFIEGIDVLREVQLGWGEAAGFEIKQMSDTSVTFPGVPTLRGRMVWRFRTQEMVTAGGYLELLLPPGLNPDCNPGQFRAISLPSAGGCNVGPATTSQPQVVTVFLNSTIVPSEYSFLLMVEPPLAQPLRNELSIYLKDKNGMVRDAAVDLPGIPIRDKLRIQAMPLVWTQSRAGRATEVTMGFTVVDELPDNIVAPEQQLWTILLTLPVGFVHLVETRLDFQILNEEMNLATPDDVDFMQKDRLRIFMNPNQTSWLTLKSGDYTFKFPALIPELLPVYNVWQLSLCRKDMGPCDRSSAPAVLVNFALPGFGVGEQYVPEPEDEDVIGVANGSVRSSEAMISVMVGALALILWHVLKP
mmetsp:Transcript_142909/g.247385  ORF Transcript_142909/g.247385 Transcript_142909/m.247385 type:complete len:2516 (+) Transcript_142909:3-7550(+)